MTKPMKWGHIKALIKDELDAITSLCKVLIESVDDASARIHVSRTILCLRYCEAKLNCLERNAVESPLPLSVEKVEEFDDFLRFLELNFAGLRQALPRVDGMVNSKLSYAEVLRRRLRVKIELLCEISQIQSQDQKSPVRLLGRES